MSVIFLRDDSGPAGEVAELDLHRHVALKSSKMSTSCFGLLRISTSNLFGVLPSP